MAESLERYLGTISSTSGPWYIRYDDCCGNTRDLDATVDEVAVWNEALDISKIALLAQGSRPDQLDALDLDQNRLPNADSKAVRHYLDGQLAASLPMSFDRLSLQLGPCEIGNWSPRDTHLSSPIRNFNGRLDELILLSTALSESEISHLFQLGRPF